MKSIETEEEHQAALTRITQLWEAKPNTPDGDELGKLADLVLEFEEDMELMQIIKNRKGQPEIVVDINDL
jgi:hypothetical protein